MSLTIQIVILFILLVIYFSSSNTNNKENLIRALILAIALPTLALIPGYLGLFGWVIAFSLALLIVSKILGQSFSGSLLFIIIIGALQSIIELGIQKFI